MEGQESKEMQPSEISITDFKYNSNTIQQQQRLSIRITMIATFSALAIGVSYILAPLINVELLSVLLFIAGFLYGKLTGLLVGLISSIIYYGWNPFGISPLPIFLATVGLMTLIAVVGGILKPADIHAKKIEISHSNIFKLAVIGFCFTLLFDISTNILIAIIYYGGDIRAAFLFGFPFMIIHLVSNTFVFAGLVLPVHNAVKSIH